LKRWYKRSGGRKFPEEPFLVARDHPKLKEYLDLLLDVTRGMDRLLSYAKTLRNLKYVDPKTKKEEIIIRNPDWRPEHGKLELQP
jgi:hypothetical protein